MSDQNTTVIDSKGRWPTPDPEMRTEPVRGPGIVAVDAQGRITSWNGVAASLLANTSGLLALGQPFVKLEVEAGRSCFLTFNSHVMADGSLICLCEQSATQASPALASTIPSPVSATSLTAALPAAVPLPPSVPHLVPMMDGGWPGLPAHSPSSVIRCRCGSSTGRRLPSSL